MNREEILATGAGRELDVLVARKVLNWEVRYEEGRFWWRGEYLGNFYPTFGELPKLSTDISAAWQVVEKFNRDEEHAWFWQINVARNWATIDLHCSIGHTEAKGHGIEGVACKTIQEAISKVALLAKLEGGNYE